MEKLYVKMDKECPMNIGLMNYGNNQLYIRVLPVFTKPDSVDSVAKRCINHSQVNHTTNSGKSKTY